MKTCKIKAKCKDLAYNKTPVLNKEIVETTKRELQELYTEYGVAEVLGVLSKLLDFEKAVPFFDKLESQTERKKTIKTIATFYRRAYNGGVERVHSQLINMWLKAGYKVVMITEEPPNDLDYFYPKDKVKRFEIHHFYKLPERLCDLQKIMTEENVDVFINHGWTTPSVLWECLLTHNLNISYIIYAHGYFSPFYVNEYALYYQIFKMADLIIALSETNARFYQMCGCKTCLIQNPVPEELKDIKQYTTLNSHHILWVGRIATEKCPLDAVRIFKKVHDLVPDAVLDIVGGAELDWLDKMENLSRELGIFDAIKFHGLQSQDNMKNFYKNAALLLFTSDGEGYPMTLLESKAFGLPCVMYSLPYLSLVKDGKGILSAEIGDIDTMAGHVVELLKNDELRKSLGNAARESFNTFADYDLSGNWKKIFDFCEGKKLNDEIFYMPDKLDEQDKYILPHLFDVLQKTAAANSLSKNFDYKLGRRMMKIPRKIIGIFKRIKER